MNLLKILDNYFYPDVRNIVLDYLYKKCKSCKLYCDDDFAFKMYDGNIICILCYDNDKFFNCKSCKLIYPYPSEDNICKMCRNKSCKYYCYNCLRIFDNDIDNL